MNAAFALLLLATLVLSILSESAYYWLVARRSPRPLRLRWVAAGNAVSLLVLVLLSGLLLLVT